MSKLGLARRALSTLLVSGVVLTLAATPASAQRNRQTITNSSHAYIDVRTPTRTLTGAESPVGAWRDARNRLHQSKAYYTFDLTSLHGAQIFSAQAAASEASVANCARTRSTELWHTVVAERPTWLRQPSELAEQDGPRAGTNCKADHVEWTVTDAIKQAVAASQPKITFALRMPDDKQSDVSYGRRYNHLRVTVEYNRAPNTPTDLGIAQRACDGTPIMWPRTDTYLRATVSDPDGINEVKVRFVIWNVNDPAQRGEAIASGPAARVSVPLTLQDGQTYEWTAQGDDGDALSPVSAPCRFTTDFTPPGVLPNVVSTDFPENGGFPGVTPAGFPGKFTFSANGVDDVVAFGYTGLVGSGTVEADQSGIGTLVVKPPSSGPKHIFVWSIDRAGNTGLAREYKFWVRSSQPEVTFTPQQPVLGDEVEFTFTPGVPGVMEYTYQFNHGPEITVAADSLGAAKVKLTIVKPWNNPLTVRARTHEGFVTEQGGTIVNVDGAAPEVTRNGDVFTFSPKMPGVVEYVYSLDGRPPQKVAAGPDGKATVTLPTEPGLHFLAVKSRNAKGIDSADRDYSFEN